MAVICVLMDCSLKKNNLPHVNIWAGKAMQVYIAETKTAAL